MALTASFGEAPAINSYVTNHEWSIGLNDIVQSNSGSVPRGYGQTYISSAEPRTFFSSVAGQARSNFWQNLGSNGNLTSPGSFSQTLLVASLDGLSGAFRGGVNHGYPDHSMIATEEYRKAYNSKRPFFQQIPSHSTMNAFRAGALEIIATGPIGARATTYRAAESGLVNTKIALQGVTDRVVIDLAANPKLAESVLSRREYARLAGGGWTAAAQYGNAVERLSAKYIRQDSSLSGILEFQAAPFKSTPDFFGFEGQNLRTLDITTVKSIPAHNARSYGSYTEYVTHPGLPSELVFPR